MVVSGRGSLGGLVVVALVCGVASGWMEERAKAGSSSSSSSSYSGWDYTMDLMSDNDCGGYEYDASSDYPNGRCGPDLWYRVSSYCGGDYSDDQSPVNIDIESLYQPHGIDELRFNVENEGDGCLQAPVKVTDSTWKVDFSYHCSESYEMTFKYNDDKTSYYATKIEFRYPAEHTIDGVAHDMEAQMFFQNPETEKYVVVAALLDAGPASSSSYDSSNKAGSSDSSSASSSSGPTAHKDNRFLARIWDQALHYPGTDHHWAAGTLNFVDRFIPSNGLKYSYYFYKGSTTQPPCKYKTKWVVMQQPVRISQSQLSAFVNSMADVNDTLASQLDDEDASAYDSHKAAGVATTTFALAKGGGCKKGSSSCGPASRPLNATARPTQPLGSRHPYDFDDGQCQTRVCHDVFSTGLDLDSMKASYMLLVLIVFTIIFEFTHHAIHHRLHHHRTGGHMLDKIFKELSILGLISFTVVALVASCTIEVDGSDIPESLFVAFEYMHLLIFVVACFYVFLSSLTLLCTRYFSRRLDKILNLQASELQEYIDSWYPSIGWHLAGLALGRSRTNDYGLVYAKYQFLKNKSLPLEFDFLKYLKYYESHLVVESLEISNITWLLSFIAVVVIYETASLDYKTARVVFPIWGWVSTVLLIVALQFARISMQRIITAHGVAHDPTILFTKINDAISRMRLDKEKNRSATIHILQGAADGHGHGHSHGGGHGHGHGGGHKAGHGGHHDGNGHDNHGKDDEKSGEAKTVSFGEDDKTQGGEDKPGHKRESSAANRMSIALKAFMKRTMSGLGGSTHFHATGLNVDAASKAAQFEAMLKKQWVPFGSKTVTTIVSEAATVVQCFYLALFFLTYKDIAKAEDNPIEYVLVFVPIAINTLLLVPALLIQRATCESLTHCKGDLIGDANEYVRGNLEMRKKLMDALFPDLNSKLMEKVDFLAILGVFEKFDDDLSFTIAPNEFLKGVQDVGLRLSAHRAKRLLRLIDEDRSGEIDPEEIFELLSEEKMVRVVEKVSNAFDKVGDRDKPGIIPHDSLERILKFLYDGDVPADVLTSANAALVSDDKTEITMGDFLTWVKKEVNKSKGEALSEMKKVRDARKAGGKNRGLSYQDRTLEKKAQDIELAAAPPRAPSNLKGDDAKAALNWNRAYPPAGPEDDDAVTTAETEVLVKDRSTAIGKLLV